MNGYVQIQASYDDDGRHAKYGFHGFTRPSGPSLDTGDLRTDPASDPSDTNIYSRTDWVWDSPLWGDDYVTSYHWSIDYF